MSAFAQGQKEPLNPIECLNAIEHMDQHFRSYLQLQCLVIPAIDCEHHHAPEQCFSKLDQIIRDYFAELRLMLPDTIEGKQLEKISYNNKLAKLDDLFSNPNGFPSTPEGFSSTSNNIPICSGASSSEHRLCKMIGAGTHIIELFYLARLAGVATP